MALRFIDSFDHYVTADVLTKWTSNSGSVIVASAGRNGTSSIRLDTVGDTLDKTIDSQATWIIGFALRFIGTPGTGNDLIVELRDGTTVHLDLRITTSSLLQLTRAGTVLGTGTTVISTNVYYYIEIKGTIDDTAGVGIVRLNGVNEISVSSVDTRNGANASANTFRFLGAGSGSQRDKEIDDFYACDTSGAVNNDFLGDVRIEALFPNGNGNSSQFDGSDGNQVDNFLLVDEAAPNGDTDYVESPDVGDKDTYAFGNLTSTTGTVYGVQILPSARKTDAGVRSIVTVARLSATETDGPTQTLSTSYTYHSDIRETKPGGGAWSISDINSAEFGQKVAA